MKGRAKAMGSGRGRRTRQDDRYSAGLRRAVDALRKEREAGNEIEIEEEK